MNEAAKRALSDAFAAQREAESYARSRHEQAGRHALNAQRQFEAERIRTAELKAALIEFGIPEPTVDSFASPSALIPRDHLRPSDPLN